MNKYINDIELHPILCKLLSYSDYDGSDNPKVISATSLLKPIRMLSLQKFYGEGDNEIELSKLIPSVFGSALHSLFEISLTNQKKLWNQFIKEPDKLEILQENRSDKEIGNWIISGKYDLLYRYKGSKWILGDLKTTSVNAFRMSMDDTIDKWVKQLSVYRWLNQDKDISSEAEIFYWFTDWSKQEALRNTQYPQQRIGVKKISLMYIKDTEEWIRNRLNKLDNALLGLENGLDIEECSDKELWRTTTQYKYYKPNKSGQITYKKAYRNFNTLQEAQMEMSKWSNGEIKKVEGQIKRCNYCSVTKHCTQYKEYIDKGLIK